MLDYTVSNVNINFNFVLKLWRDDELRKLSGKLLCCVVVFSGQRYFLIGHGDQLVHQWESYLASIVIVNLISKYSFL